MLQQPSRIPIPTRGKPLFNTMVVVTDKDRKTSDDENPKKKEDPRCFNIPVIIKGFYVGEVMCDLKSSVNMMSLSLFNKIGGFKLKPCEVRIGVSKFFGELS